MSAEKKIVRDLQDLQEVFQDIEDSLLAAEWTEIIVRCKLGYFEWKQTHNADGTPVVTQVQ